MIDKTGIFFTDDVVKGRQAVIEEWFALGVVAQNSDDILCIREGRHWLVFECHGEMALINLLSLKMIEDAHKLPQRTAIICVVK